MHGDKLALREKDYGIWNRIPGTITTDSARRTALGLLSLGIKPGDRVAIAGEDIPGMVLCRSRRPDDRRQSPSASIRPIPGSSCNTSSGHSGARVVITGDQEQTDKVLDAIASNDGLPALEAVVCVDMKGLRHYRQSATDVVRDACALGDRLRRAKTRTPTAGSTVDLRRRARRRLHPRLHLRHHRPAQGRDAHASQSASTRAYTYAEARRQIADKPFESVCYLPLCHVAERCYPR